MKEYKMEKKFGNNKVEIIDGIVYFEYHNGYAQTSIHLIYFEEKNKEEIISRVGKTKYEWVMKMKNKIERIEE